MNNKNLIIYKLLTYSTLTIFFLIGIFYFHDQNLISLFDGIVFLLTFKDYNEIIALNNKTGIILLSVILVLATIFLKSKNSYHILIITILFILMFVFFFPTKIVVDPTLPSESF